MKDKENRDMSPGAEIVRRMIEQYEQAYQNEPKRTNPHKSTRREGK